MDRVEYKICNTQRKIFELAAKKKYNIEQFTRLFLESEFCEEAFDAEYSRYQFETALECMDFIIPEIGSNLVSSYDNDIDLAGYVGFMYRFLYFITPYSSKELINKVPYNEVAKTADSAIIEGEELVAEDICLEFKLKYEPKKL